MTLRRKTILTAIAAAAIGFAAWLGHIGYFGGQVYFEIPAKPVPSAPPHTVAVIFSGDMGFRVGMGPRIADRLAADGIPVLGVSSLVHFRHERTPAEVRAFVAEAARRALAFAHADRLILIGQSFGADMLQVGAAGLPSDLRSKVQMLGLVVPGEAVVFRASPAELFNWARPDAQALPTARRLTWAPVVCIHGMEEDDSLCPRLDLSNVRQVALPGGHPLHRDPDALYAALKAEIAATQAKITNNSDARHLAASRSGAQGYPERENRKDRAMSGKLLAVAMAALALLPAASQARPARATAPEAIGTWINPRRTVKVETGDCAGKLCGWVVWAAPKAQADARDSGVARLIGTELLRDYHSAGSDRYQGRVYVPDMGHSFYSTIRQPDANTLEVSGCILGGLICKSQDWHRA